MAQCARQLLLISFNARFSGTHLGVCLLIIISCCVDVISNYISIS